MTSAPHLASGVLAAVLGAAVLHSLWNSLVKSANDKFLSSALIALWCGVAALAATLVLPWPSRAAAPFIAASALIHIVYFLLVGRLYRNADLSVAYPIMRGLAPLIAAVIAFVTLGEAPGPVAALGIAVLVGGVLLMGASGLAHGRVDAATIAVALANSLVIAVYSVIDGQGGRISGPSAFLAFAYNAWADALTAITQVCDAELSQDLQAIRHLARAVRRARRSPSLDFGIVRRPAVVLVEAAGGGPSMRLGGRIVLRPPRQALRAQSHWDHALAARVATAR